MDFFTSTGSVDTETPQQQDLFGMLDSAENDFFESQNTQENAKTDFFQTEQPVQQESIDMMLADDNSDAEDLFTGSQAVFEQPTQDSPVLQWEKEKQSEITAIDETNNEADANLRQVASEKLRQFYATIQEAQEKRKQHNKELDEQKIMAQESPSENKWENVVSYIDFNRSDLHEKDVSRMKSLLLQLKH